MNNNNIIAQVMALPKPVAIVSDDKKEFMTYLMDQKFEKLGTILWRRYIRVNDVLFTADVLLFRETFSIILDVVETVGNHTSWDFKQYSEWKDIANRVNVFMEEYKHGSA